MAGAMHNLKFVFRQCGNVEVWVAIQGSRTNELAGADSE